MSDFQDLYKNANQLQEHQISRRNKLLEEQKKRRDEKFAFQRDLKEILTGEKETEGKKKHYVDYAYKNLVMLSEWMMALPDDIENWIAVACPKGRRVVMATGDNRNSTTKLYYKNGLRFIEFKTNLPTSTILDCVYSEVNMTVYILDVISYSGRDLLDCDSAFRFFWMKSKFLEDDLKVLDTSNRNLKLKLLTSHSFSDPSAINECFQTRPIFIDGGELDGFLFYHSEASYTSGETPLVLWLFPFMLSDMFETFKINPDYNSLKPSNYKDFFGYIKWFNEKMAKKKKPRQNRDVKMEQETSEVNQEKQNQEDEESFDEIQAMIDLEMTGNI